MKAMKLAGLGVAALLAVIAVPGTAIGSQVSVQDFWNAGQNEWNLYASGAVGGTQSGIMEYLYGAGHFTRLEDSDLKLWTRAGTPGVGVDAVYASAQQNLLTATPPSGSPDSLIISPNGSIGWAPGRFLASTTFTPAADPFLFLDRVPNYGVAYSDPSLNGGSVRMVGFAVSGYLETAGDANSFKGFEIPTYVLAFEDGNDWDFQDLVVEVKGVKPVPDGGMTVALLGLGLGALALARRQFAA